MYGASIHVEKTGSLGPTCDFANFWCCAWQPCRACPALPLCQNMQRDMLYSWTEGNLRPATLPRVTSLCQLWRSGRRACFSYEPSHDTSFNALYIALAIGRFRFSSCTRPRTWHDELSETLSFSGPAASRAASRDTLRSDLRSPMHVRPACKSRLCDDEIFFRSSEFSGFVSRI